MIFLKITDMEFILFHCVLNIEFIIKITKYCVLMSNEPYGNLGFTVGDPDFNEGNLIIYWGFSMAKRIKKHNKTRNIILLLDNE